MSARSDRPGATHAAARAAGATRASAVRRVRPVTRSVADAARRGPALAVALLVATAVAIVSAVLPPLVLERVVNDLAAAGRTHADPAATVGAIAPLAVLYLGLVVVEGLAESAREATIVAFGQRVTRALRTRMCRKLRRLPASFFGAAEPGAVTSRFVGDVGAVEGLFSSGVMGMLADAGTVVSILAVVFAMSRGLGLLLMVAVPALFALTRAVQRRMLAAQTDARAAAARTVARVPEALSCMGTVRAYGREAFMEGRYAEAVDAGFEAQGRCNFLDAIYSPTIVAIGAVVVAVMMSLSVGGPEARDLFGMSVGTAVAVIAYVGKVFSPLQSIGMEIQSIQQAVAGVRRIAEFLDEPEINEAQVAGVADARPDARPDMAAAPAPVAELDHVTFSYDLAAPPVLDDFSLRVLPGETVVLVGRTGAGKSTAVKLMLGLYQPSSGQARVFGAPAGQLAESDRRPSVGYVEQRFRMVPGTVADQVTLGDARVTPDDVRAALELVGLADAVDALPRGADTTCEASTFSQGQFQLLSIARALALRPSLLLLDEITANLDSATEASVMAAIDRASEGRTVVSVSHRFDRAAAVGARVVTVGRAAKKNPS